MLPGVEVENGRKHVFIVLSHSAVALSVTVRKLEVVYLVVNFTNSLPRQLYIKTVI